MLKKASLFNRYNIRMGDPECQVIMPRLETDLFKIITNTIKNKLKKLN